jgi:hypothetical protein
MTSCALASPCNMSKYVQICPNMSKSVSTTPVCANHPQHYLSQSSISHATPPRRESTRSIRRRRLLRLIDNRSSPARAAQWRRRPSTSLLHPWGHRAIPTTILDIGWTTACITPASACWKGALSTSWPTTASNYAAQYGEQQKPTDRRRKSDDESLVVVNPRLDFTANCGAFTNAIVAAPSTATFGPIEEVLLQAVACVRTKLGTSTANCACLAIAGVCIVI